MVNYGQNPPLRREPGGLPPVGPYAQRQQPQQSQPQQIPGHFYPTNALKEEERQERNLRALENFGRAEKSWYGNPNPQNAQWVTIALYEVATWVPTHDPEGMKFLKDKGYELTRLGAIDPITRGRAINSIGGNPEAFDGTKALDAVVRPMQIAIKKEHDHAINTLSWAGDLAATVNRVRHLRSQNIPRTQTPSIDAKVNNLGIDPIVQNGDPKLALAHEQITSFLNNKDPESAARRAHELFLEVRNWAQGKSGVAPKETQEISRKVNSLVDRHGPNGAAQTPYTEGMRHPDWVTPPINAKPNCPDFTRVIDAGMKGLAGPPARPFTR